MKTTLWREKVFDLEQSARTGVACRFLGKLKAGVVVRVPIFLGLWFQRRESEREAKREQEEDRLYVEGRRQLV